MQELRRDIIDWEPERGEFGKEYKNKDTTELYITCECGSEILKLESFSDEQEVYISVFKYAPTNTSLRKRLSSAWDILSGRKISTADVVLSKENFNKIRNFNKLILIIVLFLSSCMSEKADYPTTPSKWVVKEVSINSSETNLYYVSPIESKDLNMNWTWFVDSIGKFNPGDTLYFAKRK